MKIEEFTRKFEELFDGEAGPVSPDTRFKEIAGWNSLRALYLVALIDSEFNISFTASDLQNSATVEDIYRTVQNKLG